MSSSTPISFSPSLVKRSEGGVWSLIQLSALDPAERRRRRLQRPRMRMGSQP
ncbi:MAG: hypothetical protein JWR58_2260 [Pseudonocardia sp.]|jgi:hypothetical protein|nr:hypothetical protein [Pseudonocardia sp.]